MEWFLDAWDKQCASDYSNTQLVVVDFHQTRSVDDPRFERIRKGFGQVVVSKPKPNVWQGDHKLSRIDYFAAANARNTAICLAAGSHIVFVDDLSVPLPTWWRAVQESTTRTRTITCGAYQKVRGLEVVDGVVDKFEDHPAGRDIRMRDLSGKPPYPCMPGWHFGCSVAAPIDAYLDINGWPEACDGLGYEDCVTGIVLYNRGWHFVYDTRMMTFESEEAHGEDVPFMRWDKGTSPNDKSHAMLAMFKQAARFDNYFGSEGIRGLRERVLSGESFPILQIPEHDWFDSMPIRQM